MDEYVRVSRRSSMIMSRSLVVSFYFFMSYCLCTTLGTVHSAVFDTGNLSLKNGPQLDYIARANFTDDIKNTGWAYLEVTTNPRYNDSLQAYAAGVVEASVTSQLLYKHWMNTIEGYCGSLTSDSSYCEHLRNYIVTNLQWMEAQMEKGDDVEYWHQVH